MPSSASTSADEIIKKCHDVGEKLQSESKSVNTAAHHHTSASKPVHYLHELPLAAETRYETLFNQLDRSGNELDIFSLFFFCFSFYLNIYLFNFLSNI